MADLDRIPLQDDYETTLAQAATSAGELTIYVSSTPDYTSTENTYITVGEGTGAELIKVDSYDSSLGTFTVPSGGRGQPKYKGDAGGAKSHAVGSRVIISDNFQFWEDIQTSLASKVDVTGDTMTGLLQFSGTDHAGFRAISLTTAQRTALSAANGDFVYDTDDNLFYQYKAGAWASVDTGTATPNGSDTVAGVWEGATVAEQGSQSATGGTGAGLVLQPKNLVKTSSGAGDENKAAILDSSGKFATGFIPQLTLANAVSDVTATATEINQALDGISANVTDTNLNTLTADVSTIAALATTMFVRADAGTDTELTAAADLTATATFLLPVGKEVSGVELVHNHPAGTGNVGYTSGLGFGNPDSGEAFAESSGGTVQTFTPNTASRIQATTYNLTSGVSGAYADTNPGDVVRVSFQRVGTDGSDTYNQTISVLGFRVTLTDA